MRNRRISSLLVFAAGLGFAGLSQAQEKVLIQPTHFGPNVQVSDAVKRECELEAKLDEWVLEGVSKKYPGSSVGEKSGGGKVLKLTIVNVYGVGGGAYSGPKSMTVQADLMQGTKVMASTTKSRSSGGGAFGNMKGTCAIFGRVAKALGSDVAAWLPGAMNGAK